MNRLHFLKNLLTGVGVAVAAPQVLHAESAPKIVEKHPNESAIMIYDEYVAGFKYYKGPKNLDKVQVDDEIKLIREPNNKHDEFAIGVHWGDKKLGYIRMDDNIVIANLLDNDIPLFCKISEIQKEAETWEQVAISVFLLFPCK